MCDEFIIVEIFENGDELAEVMACLRLCELTFCVDEVEHVSIFGEFHNEEMIGFVFGRFEELRNKWMAHLLKKCDFAVEPSFRVLGFN